MNEAWEVLIFIGMILAMAAIFGGYIWASRHVKKRDGQNAQQRAELLEFIESRGWSHTYSTSGDRYCGGTPLPIQGTNIPIWDYTVGEFRGRAFCCFEYNTRNSTSGPDAWQYNAVFAVAMPTPVPRMVIKKPRAVDKVNARADALFGGGKVMELGDPAFDEAFRLIVNDEEFARSALTGPMAQFLTSDPRAKDEPLRFQEDHLLTWYRGRLRPQDIDQKLNYLCDVLDQWPAQA